MRFFLLIILLIAAPLLVHAQWLPTPATYQAEWKKADSLAALGLPRSALTMVDQIYVRAKATRNYPQVAKAAMQRIAYRGFIDEKNYVALIQSVKKDIADTPEPARSVLRSVLAEIYWRYYQQNRSKFYQRTSLARPAANLNRQPPTPAGPAADLAGDPRNWDTRQLFSEIATAYDGSLKNVGLLQKTPLEAYEVIIEQGDANTRILRPTLYDLLAHRAIHYFQNTEPDLVRPIFQFELNQPAYLAAPEMFGALTLTTRDSLSGRFHALQIYQQLIRQHLSDADPASLADVDNLRLEFVYKSSVVPDKDSLYRQTLEKQAARYQNKPPVGADYLFSLSKLLAEQSNRYQALIDTVHKSDRKQAAELARNLLRQYPNTVVGINAGLLLKQLTTPTLTASLEEVTEPDKPFRVRVAYRNIATVFYRIYRVPSDADRQDYYQNGYVDTLKQQAAIRTLLSYSLVAQGQAALPDDADLQPHSVEMPIPGLPLGRYALLMGMQASLMEKASQPVVMPLRVSQLGYLTHKNTDTNTRTVYVTDRQTGQPLANVQVELGVQLRDGSTSNRRVIPTDRTDANGRIDITSVQLPSEGMYWFRLLRGPDVLITDADYIYRNYSDGKSEPEVMTTTLFFTDRVMYRPGQSIYFKGLIYSGKNNDFTVQAGVKADVFLRDTNGEEVSKLTLTTNEFGTFTGSFVAPTGRLTGTMTIVSSHGQTAIRVEEYKRPTFDVTTEPIKKSVKLDQVVALSAFAKTLSGAVVDGAQVRYRVTRRYYHPYFNYWRKQPPYVDSRMAEITSGTDTTDANGRVRISFPATADHGVSASENPRFLFTITLDVTDRAGETRSITQTLRIGYSALQAELTIPVQVGRGDTRSYAVRVTNQSGEAVPIKQGEVSISRLQAPDRLLRSRLWARPDRQLISRAEFVRLFPNDVYDDEDNPATWPKLSSQTVGLRNIVLADLLPGTYIAEVSVADSMGEMARQRLFFSIIEAPVADAPPRPAAGKSINSWVQPPKTVVQPGDEAAFLVGIPQMSTSLPMWVLMSVNENQKLIRQEWLTIAGAARRVLLPIGEKQRGEFSVSFVMIQHGRLHTETQSVQVPFTNKELTIETQTFRDKLRPGQPEEWKLKISGPAGDNVLAEVAATLYDASLDQFVKHNWETDIYRFDRYGSWGSDWQSGSFGLSQALLFFNRFQPPIPFRQRQYDQLIDLWKVSNDLRIFVTRTAGYIQGRITDVTGQGVPGVTVVGKGTQKGTATNADGSFSFAIDRATRLVRLQFRMIGYLTQEIDIDTGSRFLRMPEDAQALHDVAVVGYAMQSRKEVTGSVSTISLAAGFNPKQANDPNAQEGINNTAKPAPQAESERLSEPAIRKNFNETAFFFPQLQTDAQGAVVLKFIIPEALTRWHLMAFAHTKDLKTGLLTRDVITQKELMITANTPRFLREGDTLSMSARVNNLTDRPLTGKATLTLFDALTGKPVVGFYTISPVAELQIPAGMSTTVSWTMTVPTGSPEAVTMRFTAQAGSFSDGEERTIPVLPNRMLVTDTQPFWVNGSGITSTFKLRPLTTLSPELPVQHERLTVEVTSNPAWYALQSLPYLMEYRYECAEQLFSRLYANSLAAHILNSRPAFRQVVDAWQRQPPKSPLQTNEELKAITLENTPWLVDAQSETERTARLGQLFDQNRLNSEQRSALDKLVQLQTESGGFRWFGGMEPSLTMTLYILGGFGHLQKLGVSWAESGQSDAIQTMIDRAIQYVDAQMKASIAKQQKLKTPGSGTFFPTQYLYVRSFYPNRPVDKVVLAYLSGQLTAHWLKSSLQGQAMAALAMSRFGNKAVPAAILKSLRERATVSDELGMYWPENQPGLFWYQAPVETQASLVETFDEITNDRTTVDNLKRWLLRQKQTQSWASTKATTEAIYTLLLRGSDWLTTTPTTTVLVGGQSIKSRVTKTDVATGYQKVVYGATEVRPELGVVQISKSIGGPAWGAAYWQHFEPLDQVKSSIQAAESGLSVQKTLYIQTDSPEGLFMAPITSQTRLKPGDLIKVRVILKTDRSMEYVHLKDSRASGFEPVAALSGYKYQNGLGYYEAPRDASTDFFISTLSVGTHVFEYALRVAQTGDFSAGVATVQCFYAPEFSAHSAGERVRVK